MKTKALSLVEMAVSLAVMAVIASVTLVSFSILGSRRLETAARNLFADLGWARQMATNRHLDYIVDFDSVNDEYYIYEDQNGDGIPTANEEVRAKRLAVDMLSVTDFAGVPLPAPQRITFLFPLGTSQDSIINFGHEGRIRPVRVYGQTSFIKLEPII